MDERSFQTQPDIHKSSIHEALKDPIGVFLRTQKNVGDGGASFPIPTTFIKTMNPDRRAESMWTLYQDVRKCRRLTAQNKPDPALAKKLALLAALYADTETRATYLANLERHATEQLAINGTFEMYRGAQREHEQAEHEFDGAAAALFSKRGSGASEFDVLLFETAKQVEKQKREKVAQFEGTKPEVAALIQYETLKKYSRELAHERFAWLPSRRKYLEEIEDAAIGGKPLLVSGQSGTGKTELLKAAARRLTGREIGKIPGKDTRMEKLIAETKISPTGATYYEYKVLGEALTGRESTLRTKPDHEGRMVLHDEFNLLDSANQTELLAEVASWKPGTRIRVPVTNEEIEVPSKFLYTAAVNLASSRYKRNMIPPEVLRKFSKVDVDYPPQNAAEPELYEMMLAALMDENGRMLAAETELVPAYSWRAETRDAMDHGMSVRQHIKVREFDNSDPAAHGFLWRFAEAINQINLSFSEKETVLKSRGAAQYIKELVIDMGTVTGWLESYRRLGRGQTLEAYMSAQVFKEFTSKAAYTAGDRDLVNAFMAHFGITTSALPDVEAESQKNAAPFKILTPIEVGKLSPRVKFVTIERTEARVKRASFIEEDGTRVAYSIEAADTPLGRLEPGQSVEIGGNPLIFHGVRVDNGEFVFLPPPKVEPPIPAAPPSIPLHPRPGTRDPFIGKINEAEARRLGLEKVQVEAFPQAQELIKSMINSTMQLYDVATAKGRLQFFTEWRARCPDLPPPCVLKDKDGKILPDQTKTTGVDWDKSDFWYLHQLQAGKINSNLDKDNPILVRPSFDKSATLFVMDWEEEDYNFTYFGQTKSLLLKELLGTESVVNIKREDLDSALWQGDPSLKIKTSKHTDIIKNLGLNPNTHNFRLIAQDEYARLAPSKNWGTKNLWTMYNNYVFGDVNVRGLRGGNRGNGGASRVDDDWRVNAFSDIAVRLVLECTV